MNIVKDNKVLSQQAENARNHMEEVNTILVAIAFREVGNRSSKFQMRQFKNEIEKITSDMRNELDN